MNTFKILFLLMTFMMILVGCTEAKILERVSLTTLIGYDLADGENVATTAVIRQINPDLESKVEIQSATAKTSKGARVQIDLKTSKKIASGQLRVVLFGEEFAKKGLNDALHLLKMNAEISNGIYLAVVEGESKSLIEHKYQNITDIGQFIFQLIEHNITQQHSISPTLHEINRDILSETTDFAMPILKKEGEYINISGIAFFKDGSMVGNLPSKDTFYVRMIRGNFRYGTLEMSLPIPAIKPDSSNSSGEYQIAIDSIQSRRKITVVDQTIPEFDLTINIECRLLEIQTDANVSDPKIMQDLEKEINKKIESEIKRIIQYSQKINSDIFGFGQHYKAQVRNTNIDEEKWHRMYPKMKVNITVNTKILRHGIFQ